MANNYYYNYHNTILLNLHIILIIHKCLLIILLLKEIHTINKFQINNLNIPFDINIYIRNNHHILIHCHHHKLHHLPISYHHKLNYMNYSQYPNKIQQNNEYKLHKHINYNIEDINIYNLNKYLNHINCHHRILLPKLLYHLHILAYIYYHNILIHIINIAKVNITYNF